MKPFGWLIAWTLALTAGVATLVPIPQPATPPQPPTRVVSVTTTYTAGPGEVVMVDPSGGGFTVTLPPTGGGVNRGRGVWVVNSTSSTNTVTIAAQGSGVTVDGAASVTTAAAYSARQFVCNGSNWFTGSGRALVAADIPSLDAAKITSGTIDTARLGSGTANSKTYLKGNQTWSAGSYSLVFGTTAVHNPADATTYYVGQIGQAATTTPDTRRVYVPVTGTITACIVNVNSVTVTGTNESIQVNLRINNTTDASVGTVAAATAYRTVSNTAMSASVTAGDYIEGKITAPTWATNPQGVTWWFTVVIAGGFISWLAQLSIW